MSPPRLVSFSNSISLTNTRGQAAWWKLTFSTTYYIDSIVIYNREDDFQFRIDGLQVYVELELVDTRIYVKNKNPYKVSDLDLVGTEVTLRPSKDNHLQLAEIKVFGTEFTGILES